MNEHGAITREMEARMIARQELWPGETLCMKKYPKPGEKAGVMGYSEFGILTSPNLPLIIYLRPNFEIERHYASIDVMLDDGWVVD